MGVEKTYRPTVTGAAQTLAASGTIKAYPEVTVCTVTSTGVVFKLPPPMPGLEKTVVLDYTGATGNVTFANASTATVFNGSTANIITVSSSEEHAVIRFVGMSSAAYSAMWSVSPTTAAPGLAFAASTLTS
jgi:hypothetical protein